MIYCSWESGNRQFVSACVERNGNIILYESGHDRIEGVEKEQYLKNLGNALSVLKPSNNRLNCNTNMNKKLIRLTESDLHRIVKESVNRILNERVHNFKPNEFDWDEELDLMPYDGNREEYETMYNYDPKLALRGDGNEISRKQNGELKSYAKYKENRPWLDLSSSQRRLANDRIFDDQEQSVRNYGRKEAERALYDRSSEKDDV